MHQGDGRKTSAPGRPHPLLRSLAESRFALQLTAACAQYGLSEIGTSLYQHAVLQCPPMRSIEYLKAVLKNAPPGFTGRGVT
jgi:hypothetical protein